MSIQGECSGIGSRFTVERAAPLFLAQSRWHLAPYHKRSNVETAFSMIKMKFGSFFRSKSDVGQINELLYKVICHNLCVLIIAIHEMELEPRFDIMNEKDKKLASEV